MKLYMQWALWLTILLAVGTVGMFAISSKAGLLMILLTVIYAAAAWLLCAGSQKDLFAEMIDFAAQYGQIQKKLLKDFHVPYALMDENGKLLWMNEAFMEVTGRDKSFHKSITSIFPQITKESFSGEEADIILEYHVEYEERAYRAQVQQVSVDEWENARNDSEFDEYA